MADGPTHSIVPTTREPNGSNGAFLELLNAFDASRPRTPLISHLHHAIIFARGAHHRFSLPRIMRARFLDINVFARVASHDRRGRMPMIRRGDENGVEVF